MDDFLELGQTSQDLDIEYDIGDLEPKEISVTQVPGFQYPAMEISGVAYNDTIKVLQTCSRNSYRSIDVWLNMNDGSTPIKLDPLPLEMETLLMMRFLGVSVTLYLSPDEDVQPFDFSDVSELEKYI